MLSERSRGEMDITTVFGTVVPGSSPGGSTNDIMTCPAARHYAFVLAGAMFFAQWARKTARRGRGRTRKSE